MAWQDRSYNQNDAPFTYRFGFTPPPRMTLCVMTACLVVFVAEALSGDVGKVGNPVVDWCGLTFEQARAFTQPWRWISYQYVHGGALHIFFNLLGVYFFLSPLERLWGSGRAFAFYTAGGIVGGIAFGILSSVVRQAVPLIGASGSVFAALGACALLFPEKQVLLLVIPVPIRVLAALLALFFVLTIVGERNLSDAAHLGGLGFGVLAPYYGATGWRRLQHRWRVGQQRRELYIQREDDQSVDRILQKVHDSGMNSLSRAERKTLKRATDRQRQREMAVARGRR